MTPRVLLVLSLLGSIALESAASPVDRTTASVEPRTWLNDQVLESRRAATPEIERDAIRRLTLMDPQDANVILEELRLLIRSAMLSARNKSSIDNVVQKLCELNQGAPCQQARILVSLIEDKNANKLSEARMLAAAGNPSAAIEAFDNLFGGRPQEESLLLEYAELLSQIPGREEEALRLWITLARSDSQVIALEAKTRAEHLRFERTLEQALVDAFTNGRRQSAVPVLANALKTRPDDDRAPRWSRALASARFWLAIDRGDAALGRSRLKEAEKQFLSARRIAPENPYGYLGLASVCEAREELDAAARWVDQGLRAAKSASASELRRMKARKERLLQRAARANLDRMAPKTETEMPSPEYLEALRKYCLDTKDPWRTLTLANALVRLGRRHEAGLLFADASKAGLSGADEERRHAAALFYRSIDDDAAALAVLEPFMSGVELSPAPARRLESVRSLYEDTLERWAVREARRLVDEGRRYEAAERLRHASVSASWNLASAAEIAETAGDIPLARAFWQKLGKSAEWTDEARLREAALLIESSDKEEALGILTTWETEKRANAQTIPSDLLIRWVQLMTAAGAEKTASSRLPYWLARLPEGVNRNAAMLFRDLAMSAEARGATNDALEHYRNAFRAAGLAAGRDVSSDAEFTLAMRTPDTPCCKAAKAGDWLEVSLRDRAAETYKARQSYVKTEAALTVDDGTPGWSDMKALVWMKEAGFPLAGGRAVLRADTVRMDTGNLKNGRQSFGFLDVDHDARIGKPVNKDTGESIAFAWQSDKFGFDIGTTPLGFLYEDIVGGVNWKSSVGGLSVTTELYRRAEIGSLLAFGGQRDPLTGLTWGGVRRLGAAVNLSADDGGTYGFWSKVAVERLTGHRVADNKKLALMGGAYRRLIDCPHWERTAGASLFYWHYQKDLSDYYMGQGGYYSPNNYIGMSLSLEEARRYSDWSWWLQGRIGASYSGSKGRDIYPLKKPFAEALAMGISQSTIDELNPNARDVSESSTGISAGIRGRIERRFTSRWIGGAEFSYQKSQDYNPFMAGLWLRYTFTDWNGDLNLPPKPMVPYAEW